MGRPRISKRCRLRPNESVKLNETNDYEKRNESKSDNCDTHCECIVFGYRSRLPPTPGGMASSPCKRDTRHLMQSMGRKRKQMVGQNYTYRLMTGLFISLDDYIIDPIEEEGLVLSDVTEEYFFYASKMNKKKEPTTSLKCL